MRREQTRGRWRSKAERNLAHGLGEVRRLASSLELADSVRDQACQLFRSAQNEDPVSWQIYRSDSGSKHLWSLSL